MNAPNKDLFSLVGKTLVDKYEVEKVLDGGRCSAVYRARQLQHDRAVRLELFEPPANATPAEREFLLDELLRDARALVRVEHPHLARVFEAGQTKLSKSGDCLWAALEFVPGAPLSEQLAARRGQGGLAPAEALALLRPAFEAAAALHAKGLTHGALSPETVLVVQGAQGPTVKLTGYSFGREPESFAYAAPEQTEESRRGPFTDVHALALLLTELLTDKAPYGERQGNALREAARAFDRPSPARLGREVGVWESVLQRALSARPSERFPDAAKFLAALDIAMPSAAPRASLRPGSAPPPRSSVPDFQVRRAGTELPRFPWGGVAALLTAAGALGLWWRFLANVSLGRMLVRWLGEGSFPVWSGVLGTSLFLSVLLLVYGAASRPVAPSLFAAGLGALSVAAWGLSGVWHSLFEFHERLGHAVPYGLGLLLFGLGLRSLNLARSMWRGDHREGRDTALLALFLGWLLLLVGARTADPEGALLARALPPHVAPRVASAPPPPLRRRATAAQSEEEEAPPPPSAALAGSADAGAAQDASADAGRGRRRHR